MAAHNGPFIAPDPVTAQAWLTLTRRVPLPTHGLRHLLIQAPPRAPITQLRPDGIGATGDYPTAPIGAARAYEVLLPITPREDRSFRHLKGG